MASDVESTPSQTSGDSPEHGCSPDVGGYDLLRIGAVRKLMLWSGFPYVFQAVMLVAFVGLAAIGWGLHAPDGVPDKLFAKCNIVNLLIWGLWWPAMVWGAVLFGRAWCTVCPLELVANVSERLGRAIGIPQSRLGKGLAAGGLILVLYILIQFLIAGLHIHRVPHFTSLFLLTLLAVAAITGLFIKDRAFCRGFCPVGLLLGTYGRGGMLAVRAKFPEVCRSCTEKGCVASCNRTALDGRSCPSLLDPATVNGNGDCLVCGQCIKACEPGNMQLLLRRPFSPGDTREPLASWPVTLFVIAVSGFVAYELCSEWAAAKKVFMFVPDHLVSAVGSPGLAGWFKGIWMLIVLPGAAWAGLGLVTMILGGASGLGMAWRRLALPMVVIVAAAHMAKGLAKLSSWGGYLPLAVGDSEGAETATRLHAGEIAVPQHLLDEQVVSCVGVAMVVLALCYAVREARLANPSKRSLPVVVPVVLTAVVCGTLVGGWSL